MNGAQTMPVDMAAGDVASSGDGEEPYNAGNKRHVKERRAALRRREAQHASVVAGVMATVQGRWWVYDRLAACHIYGTSFDRTAMVMAFAEGERNIGIQFLNEIMHAAPERYLDMIREAKEREDV